MQNKVEGLCITVNSVNPLILVLTIREGMGPVEKLPSGFPLLENHYG